MNKHTAAFLKWAGILLIFANVMVWEGMFLARRWRKATDSGPRRSLREQYPDTACPEPKTVHTKCVACECRIKDKLRLEREAAEARTQRDAFERSLAQQRNDLAALKAAVRERDTVTLANPEVVEKAVLVATPVKNSADKITGYFNNLQQLTYPKSLMSLAFIVSDSLDNSAREVRNRVSQLKGTYRRATVLQRDFGFQQAPDPQAVPTSEDEAYRRAILARSRNSLLFAALHDEGWVLWLDVDIVQYPRNLLEEMMRHGADIVTTNCVYVDDGGAATDRRCEYGSWAETPESRAFLRSADPQKPLFEGFEADEAYRGTRLRLGNDSLADRDTVPLDAIGAATTLVRADLHRDGLLFPHVLYDHQIEAEGFGKMAVAAGYQPIGLPGIIVHHAAVHVKPQPTWR